MLLARALPCAAVAATLALWSPVTHASGSQKAPVKRGATRGAGTRAKKPAAAGTRTRKPAATRLTATRAPRAPRATTAKPPRAATAKTPRPGVRPDGRLTREQREQAAVAGVRKVLAPWVGRGIDVRLSITQIQLNPTNRLLGRGPVNIVVTPKVTRSTTRWQRFTSAFRPSLNRRMLVAVSDGGHATVLSDTPNAIQHRIARAITDRIPLPEIMHDVLTSKQSQAGLVGAIGSTVAFAVSPPLAVAGLAAGTVFVLNGRRERNAARADGMTKTVAWARAREQAGNLPALSETYRYYQMQLADTSTKPIPFRQFVERLTLEEFRGAADSVPVEAAP